MDGQGGSAPRPAQNPLPGELFRKHPYTCGYCRDHAEELGLIDHRPGREGRLLNECKLVAQRDGWHCPTHPPELPQPVQTTALLYRRRVADSQPFPVDPATLVMLRAACLSEGWPDGKSHLQDFLRMGEQIEHREQEPEPETGGEVHIFEVRFKAGRAPYSPHDAIVALIDEVERLRQVVDEADQLRLAFVDKLNELNQMGFPDPDPEETQTDATDEVQG